MRTSNFSNKQFVDNQFDGSSALGIAVFSLCVINTIPYVCGRVEIMPHLL